MSTLPEHESFDFSVITNEQNLRAALGTLTDNDNGPYEWIRPLETTLDKWVHVWLSMNPPRADAYDVFLVEEHFSEAGALLDRCLSRRSEIQALETQAMTLALDYKLAEELRYLDYKLAALQLAANLKQAAIDDSAYKQALDEKNKLLVGAQEARLVQHNIPGSSLNYGERILILRELYADNIKTIFERLIVCKIGLVKFFNIEVDESKFPFPSYHSELNYVLALTKWIRSAIDEYQVAGQKERIKTVYLRLGADQVLEGGLGEIQSALRKVGDADVTFEIDAKKHLGVEPGTDVCRLIGLAATPVFSSNADLIGLWFDTHGSHSVRADFVFFDEYFRRERRTYSFPVQVQLPPQHVKVNGADKIWPTERISLVGQGAWSEGPVESATMLESGNLVRNRSPLGRWTLTLSDSAICQAKQVKRHALAVATTADPNEVLSIEAGLMGLADVVLALRIAVRR